MTQEQLRIILRAALTGLLRSPEIPLVPAEPWVTHGHVHFVLALLNTVRMEEPEDREARDLIQQAAALVRQQRGDAHA